MRRRTRAFVALLLFIVSLIADAGRATVRLERLRRYLQNRRRAERGFAYSWAPEVAPRRLNYAFAFAQY